MPSLNQLIFQVLDTANKGKTNRAHEVGERLVARWINKYANYLVAQDITRKNFVDPSYQFDLGCLTLTQADAAMCSTYCWGEDPVYYVDIPALLNLPNNMALAYFGLVSKQDRINISEYDYGNYSNYNRFAPKKIYGQRIGNRIVLYNVEPMWALEGVNVRGVWADVTNLVTASSPTDPIKCFDWNLDTYPIPASMEAALMDLIFQKELQISRSMVTDKRADEVTAEAL